MVTKKELLLENTHHLSEINQEKAAETEEVSASIEQTTDSMEQLNKLASELETFAVEIQLRLLNFNCKKV